MYTRCQRNGTLEPTSLATVVLYRRPTGITRLRNDDGPLRKYQSEIFTEHATEALVFGSW